MLNIGNRIKYNNTIYRIIGINFSTYYLRADNSTSSYDYDMQDVYRQYKDFEILERNIKVKCRARVPFVTQESLFVNENLIL